MRKKILLPIFLTVGLTAAENGASISPLGVETILPGLLPPAGKTLLLQCNSYYEAYDTLDASGHSRIPGFHLTAAVFGVKVIHNWGVKALGGELVSTFALPVLDVRVLRPPLSLHKTGIGNPNLGVLAVAYQTGIFRYWYGVNIFAPAPAYKKDDPLHIGQHYFATAPAFAITALPHHAISQISVKAQYILPAENTATQYRSGRELLIEYAATQNITRKFAAGINGFVYNQTSDDYRNGSSIGNRAHSLAIGPQIRYHLGLFDAILKYQREMLVANKTVGNSVWLQLGIPLWGREH